MMQILENIVNKYGLGYMSMVIVILIYTCGHNWEHPLVLLYPRIQSHERHRMALHSHKCLEPSSTELQPTSTVIRMI